MEKETECKTNPKVNQGANVRKFRQFLNIKQGDLAQQLGLSQQMISYIEQQKLITNDLLVKIAEALKVPVELIEKLDDNPMSVIIENNTFENGSLNSTTNINEGTNTNVDNNIHPIDKVMEIAKETASLYERIIALEKEKLTLLEQSQKEK